MGKRTTRTKQGAQRRKKPTKRRMTPWVVLGVCVLVVVALPSYRWWALGEEKNVLKRGFGVLVEEGCAGCHRPGGEVWRWGGRGGDPVSLEMVRVAVVNGAESPDLPGLRMPAYGKRLKPRAVRAAVTAVGAITRLVGVPEEPEVAAGLDVANELGCFGCHGLLGAGGVSNPGSLLGEVPGWYGRGFKRARSGEGGVKALLREGSRPARIPIPGTPRPVLAMPAWGSRLDSIELDVLVRYVTWLHDQPPEPVTR